MFKVGRVCYAMPMKKTIALTACAAALLIGGCSQPSPAPPADPLGLESLIGDWSEAGKLVRPCETNAYSKDCQFALRDANAIVSPKFQPLMDAGLASEPGYQTAYNVSYGWAFHESRCFGNVDPRDSIHCTTSAPSEADADKAISGLKALQSDSSK